MQKLLRTDFNLALDLVFLLELTQFGNLGSTNSDDRQQK